MTNWSQLHWDLLNLVARKLTNVPDHLAFSAVCSSWRSVALDIRPSFPCPFPGLMIRGEDDHGYFISLSNRRVYNQKLLIPHEDWYIGTHGGWLVTVHKNMDMSLYNPFAGDRLSLPPATSVPKLGEYGITIANDVFVRSAALSCSNFNVNPKDLTVMITQGGGRRLAFAKPGDSSWQIIDNDQYLFYDDVAFYRGKFYATGFKGTVVCDIGPSPKVLLIASPSGSRSRLYECTRRYLVESQGGDLIMVERLVDLFEDMVHHVDGDSDDSDNNENNDDDDDEKYNNKPTDDHNEDVGDCFLREKRTYVTALFVAYRMDFVGQQWVRLEGIGDQVFFLGSNTAFSLPAPVGEGNRIYFTDDYGDGQFVAVMENGKLYASDMGVFNFTDQSICPHINIDAAAVLYPPPMWAIHLPW